MAKPALGRGLAALLGGSPPEAKTPPVPIQPAHAMTAAPVVLNQTVLPVRPPNAEPLLFAIDVNAYVISVRPCGP